MAQRKIKFKHFFYVSNLLSISRIILVLPVMILLKINTPLGNIFLITLAMLAILTDYLDGFFSRRFNQVTEIGKILDPLADKIAMAAILIGLIMYRYYPVALVIMLLYRDLLILIFGAIVAKKRKTVPPSNWWGKTNTTVVSLGGLMFILNAAKPVLTFFLCCSCLTIFVSGISYYRLGEEDLIGNTVIRWVARVLVGAITALVIVASIKIDKRIVFYFQF